MAGKKGKTNQGPDYNHIVPVPSLPDVHGHITGFLNELFL